MFHFLCLIIVICLVECGANSQRTTESSCTTTCANPDANVMCPYADKDDCSCKPGYVVNTEGHCVPLNDCGCLKTNADGTQVFIINNNCYLCIICQFAHVF